MATELSNYHWCSSNADGDALSNGHWVIILPFGFIKCLCVIPWPLSHQITIGFHQMPMPMRYTMTTGFIKLTFESSNADADGHWVIILPLGVIKCRCVIQWPLGSSYGDWVVFLLVHVAFLGFFLLGRWLVYDDMSDAGHSSTAAENPHMTILPYVHKPEEEE